MIVLDTNVWSEPLRARPDPRVLEWFEANVGSAALTSITVAELRYGVERLSRGRRRVALEAALDGLIADVGDAVLPLDSAAASEYATLRAEREAMGRPISVEDGMIAGICRSHGVPLATRNVDDFDGIGVTLINPWAA